MRCPRCGHRIRGASWYCPNCGAGTDNLADEVVRDQRRRRRALVATAASALAIGAALWLATRPAPPAVVLAPTPTARPTAAVAPTRTPRREPARPEAAPSPTQPKAAVAALPTARVREGSPVWNAPRLAEPPVLDGWLDDWRSTSLSLAAIVEGEAAWDGAADLSARALVGWDDAALYVGVRVFDAWFSPPPPGAAMDAGDHVVLQLDADLYGDWDRRTYDIDDWTIGLSPGDLAGRAPEGWVWRPRVDAADRIRVAARRLADGYTLEAAVPWSLIEQAPRPGGVVGFALSVVDVDGGADDVPVTRTVIATSPDRTPDDPRTLGALVFE